MGLQQEGGPDPDGPRGSLPWASGVRPHEPKVHFDLEGYDILFWTPEDLPKLRDELTERIRRRLTIVRRTAMNFPAPQARAGLPVRARGETGLKRLDRTGCMEVAASIRPAPTGSPGELRDAVPAAEIRAFGWPIGVTLDNREEYRPRPTSEGILAEVAIFTDRGGERSSGSSR